MTKGQGPYGEHFKLVPMPYQEGQDIAARAYVLRADETWHVRSNLASKQWHIYHGIHWFTTVSSRSRAMSIVLAVQELRRSS